jgi:hypothetical protein
MAFGVQVQFFAVLVSFFAPGAFVEGFHKHQWLPLNHKDVYIQKIT